MKKQLITLFFILQMLPGWSNSHATSITDSLLTVLSALPHDTTRLKTLHQIILTSQDTPLALKYAQQLYKEAKLQNNKLYICDGAYFQTLYYYNNDGEQDSISKWVNLLKPIAQSIQYWKVYFNSQKLLINTYVYNNQYEYAFNEASKMLEKAQSIKSVTGEASAYQCLANIYHETNRRKDEEKVLRKLYELFPQITHPGTQINILSQLITFSKQTKCYTDLETFLDKSKEVLDKMVHNNPAILKSISNQYLYVEIYYTYLYLETGNQKLAKEHYKKCSAYITPNSFLPYLVLYRNMAMEYHLTLKEYDTALAIADSAIRFVQENDFDISDYAKETGYKADILKEMERYTEALPLYEEIIQIEDSISDAISNQQLEEIKESYHLSQLILEQGQLKGYIQIIILVAVAVILMLYIMYTIRINRIRKELKSSERQTKEATRKTEEANEQKNRFLANMSHEIRTPLNAIVGFSRIIAESTDAEERKSFYDIVEANNERLLQLINEILDLSKIEAGIVEFTITPVRLHSLCREIYDALKFRCPQGVKLIYEPSDEEITIEGDKNRIFQVISNLIGNAFKFTTQGKVSYGYRRKGDGIEFHVSDTGIGIEAGKLDKVFERFVKMNSFAQGTGLGLSICKTIIERLGGTISASSEMGKGTTFTFTLPEKQEETADKHADIHKSGVNAPTYAQKENNASLSGEEHQGSEQPHESSKPGLPTILVAEDTDSNYILVKAILGKSYHLERAKDGMEAVTIFEELHPDLILMDMKMPNLDGLDATKIIRELSPKIPIIALTAYAYECDRQAALKAGCNEFLTKPYKQEELKEVIERHLEEKDVQKQK